MWWLLYGRCQINAHSCWWRMYRSLISIHLWSLLRNSMLVAVGKLSAMSIHQNTSEGRHWTLAMFLRENMPGFYFTIEWVFLRPPNPIMEWLPPLQPKGVLFSLSFRICQDLDFLGCGPFFFFLNCDYKIDYHFVCWGMLYMCCTIRSLDKTDCSSTWMHEIKSASCSPVTWVKSA